VDAERGDRATVTTEKDLFLVNIVFPRDLIYQDIEISNFIEYIKVINL